MAEQAMRIALLARAGNARDQLHRALTDLGAELVAEGDPSELDPAVVASLKPALVLISIEPAIEAAIDRFDDLLATPGVDVMFDDAEVTRQLDGWDLNRWARHLAAKLLGTDVLPPPPEGSAGVTATPVVSQAPEAGSAAATQPTAAAPARPAPAVAEISVEEISVEEFAADLPMPSLGLDLDPADVELAIGRMDAGIQAPAAGATKSEDGFVLDVDVGDLDQMLDAGPEPTASRGMGAKADTLLVDIDFDAQPGGFSQFGAGDDVPASGLDDDVAALAAQLDALAANDRHQQPQEPDFSRAVEDNKGFDRPSAGSERASAGGGGRQPVSERTTFDFSALSLAPVDDAPAAAPPPARAPAAPTITGSLNLTLETIPDELAAGGAGAGAVLILAGLGGPDAVRQLLKALPARLPVPVLVYQHLEVGNHDRLVGQLAKVSPWPVYLASAGMRAQLGQVAVLPSGVGAGIQGDSLVFANMANQARMVESLPPEDSLVFVLSGADPAAVPAVLALAGQGGVAMAQDPGSCFDPEAAQALVAGGAKSGDAMALARQLSTRWA